MHLSLSETLDLDFDRFEKFLALRIPEGLYLDYKEALPEPFDKVAKREFLKDVTAFANTAGGHLIVGCKEPQESLSIQSQLVGIESGYQVAQNLERLVVTSIDPRISGLQFKVIDIPSGRSCLIIRVPPSLGRPHMVVHSGHRSFFVRNTESSSPMSTHEIRQAVLTSASATTDARKTSVTKVREVQERFGSSAPLVFVQAIPLIPPEKKWDVLSQQFDVVARGTERRARFKEYCDLSTPYQPRPTIEGISTVDDRSEPSWEVEIHRTGYMSAVIIHLQIERNGGQEFSVLHSGYGDFFRAFCHLVHECLSTAGDDLPYLFTCVHLNSGETRLWTDSGYGRRLTRCDRKKIQWPEHFRETGQDTSEIGKELVLELFYAFGFSDVTE